MIKNTIAESLFTRQRDQGKLLFALIDVLCHINNNFKKIILIEFESESGIYSDLISSLDSPNCSCRKRVKSYLTKNWDRCFKKLKRVLSNDEIDKTATIEVFEFLKKFIDSYNNVVDDEEHQEIKNRIEVDSHDIITTDDVRSSPVVTVERLTDILNRFGTNIESFLNTLTSFHQDIVSRSSQELPKKGVMGLNFSEVMNLIPNIKTMSGIFVTIASNNYRSLFDYIEEHNCPYKGVSVHKEHDILHIFFY